MATFVDGETPDLKKLWVDIDYSNTADIAKFLVLRKSKFCIAKTLLLFISTRNRKRHLRKRWISTVQYSVPFGIE